MAAVYRGYHLSSLPDTHRLTIHHRVKKKIFSDLSCGDEIGHFTDCSPTNPVEDRAKCHTHPTFGSIFCRIGGEQSIKCQFHVAGGMGNFILHPVHCRLIACEVGTFLSEISKQHAHVPLIWEVTSVSTHSIVLFVHV